MSRICSARLNFYQEAQRAGVKPILPVFAAATTTLTALTHHVVRHRYFHFNFGQKIDCVTVYSLPR
jgi:hypothetical protein